MTDLKSFGESIVRNLEQVILGKSQSVELVVIGLGSIEVVLIRGHTDEVPLDRLRHCVHAGREGGSEDDG